MEGFIPTIILITVDFIANFVIILRVVVKARVFEENLKSFIPNYCCFLTHLKKDCNFLIFIFFSFEYYGIYLSIFVKFYFFKK